MKVYQQQMLMSNGDWDPIGWEDDFLINFPTKEQAESDLEDFFVDMEDAVLRGDIEDFSRSDYRVMEVEV
jgi:hypothetical protein